MARMVEPDGAVAACARPFRPPAYEPSRVPDPITCAGAVITINDRHDGNPRPHLAMSNGASWDRYVRADEVESLVRKLVTELLKTPPNIDLAPLVRDEVRAIVPSLVDRASRPVIQQQPPMIDPNPALAEAIMQLNEAHREMAERLSAIEGTEVIVGVDIKGAAA